jgi:competence protein ComEC
MHYGLASLTVCYCLGILLASWFELSFITIYAAALCFFAAGCFFAGQKIIFNIVASCLIVLMGTCAYRNATLLPQDHISRAPLPRYQHVYQIRGIVMSDQKIKNGRPHWLFRVKEVTSREKTYRCRGNILAAAKTSDSVAFGDELMLTGTLYRPFLRKRPHRPHMQASCDAYYIMSVKGAAPIAKVRSASLFDIRKFSLWVKSHFTRIIAGQTSPLTSSVLLAMVLGEKTSIPPIVYDNMMKSGTVHILVVSGFNVGLVFFLMSLSMKLIRIPRTARMWLAIPFLIIYCFMTGTTTPVVRATVMAIAGITAYLSRRELNMYNACSIAALCILGLDPAQLFDIGFELSFASVLSIIMLYPKIRSLFYRGRTTVRFVSYLIDAALLSLAAWIGTAGLVFYYFKIISPVTVLANLFVVPLASLITLSGFTIVFACLVLPGLSPFIAASAELFVTLLAALTGWVVKFPGAYYVFK